MTKQEFIKNKVNNIISLIKDSIKEPFLLGADINVCILREFDINAFIPVFVVKEEHMMHTINFAWDNFEFFKIKDTDHIEQFLTDIIQKNETSKFYILPFTPSPPVYCFYTQERNSKKRMTGFVPLT